MSFDLEGLRAAVATHGRVVRVVIADIKGSSPREVGAAMLVWESGQSGTIGGGALEFEAAKAARALQADRFGIHPLGPELGQCCGGSVSLLSEIYDASRVDTLQNDVVARAIKDAPMPLAVKRILATARGSGTAPAAGLVQGWLVEPVLRPKRNLWVWGAGHVGRALVNVMAPLPEVAITWIDTGHARFPDVVPAGVTVVPAADPATLVRHAPASAEHIVLTYSHALDLALCHALLRHGFGRAGVIGSKTKWARFRSRLADLGHSAVQIAQIDCPIGDPSLGKHPQAIAVGVAQDFMRRPSTATKTKWAQT